MAKGFPKIEGCLVCEDVRGERLKKATILGFYGLVPNVDIIVKELNKPIEKLCFHMLGGIGEGKFKIALAIAGSDKSILVKSPEGTIELSPENRKTFITFALGNLIFHNPDTYSLLFYVDGNVHYEDTFKVLQGRDQDFI